MTLEHSFLGLRASLGEMMFAVADDLFDLTSPANAMTAEVLQSHAKKNLRSRSKHRSSMALR